MLRRARSLWTTPAEWICLRLSMHDSAGLKSCSCWALKLSNDSPAHSWIRMLHPKDAVSATGLATQVPCTWIIQSRGVACTCQLCLMGKKQPELPGWTKLCFPFLTQTRQGSLISIWDLMEVDVTWMWMVTPSRCIPRGSAALPRPTALDAKLQPHSQLQMSRTSLPRAAYRPTTIFGPAQSRLSNSMVLTPYRATLTVMGELYMPIQRSLLKHAYLGLSTSWVCGRATVHEKSPGESTSNKSP